MADKNHITFYYLRNVYVFFFLLGMTGFLIRVQLAALVVHQWHVDLISLLQEMKLVLEGTHGVVVMFLVETIRGILPVSGTL